MPFQTLSVLRHVTSTECLYPERGRKVALDVAVHANRSGNLIVLFPGYGATVDSENPELNDRHPLRYLEIAEAMQEAPIGAVVRAPNRHLPFFRYEEQVVNDLRAVISYVLEKAAEICGNGRHSLYLMGFSAGAGVVAALASEFCAKRILLLAPSGDAGPELITAAFKDYCGEVHIVVGEKDEVVTRDAGNLFDELSPLAIRKRLVIVPKCDHFFTRPEHDRVFRRAPFWAFSNDPVYEDLMGPDRDSNGFMNS